MAKNQPTLSKFGFFTRNPENEEEKRRRRTESQDKYNKNKRQRLFQNKWLEEFPGLEYNEEEEKMYCSICTRHRTRADTHSSFFTGCSTFRKPSIQSHWISTSHKACAAADAPVRSKYFINVIKI